MARASKSQSCLIHSVNFRHLHVAGAQPTAVDPICVFCLESWTVQTHPEAHTVVVTCALWVLLYTKQWEHTASKPLLSGPVGCSSFL